MDAIVREAHATDDGPQRGFRLAALGSGKVAPARGDAGLDQGIERSGERGGGDGTSGNSWA